MEAVFLGGARVDVEHRVSEVAQGYLLGLLGGSKEALLGAGSTRAAAGGHYTTARFHAQ